MAHLRTNRYQLASRWLPIGSDCAILGFIGCLSNAKAIDGQTLGKSMSGTVTAQLIELEGYTKSELRWKLAQMGGKPVPIRTLNHWIAALTEFGICVTPNRFGLYEADDLKLLARLMFWLKRRKTIAQFADLITEDSNHASRNQAQAHTNPRSRTAHRSSAIVRAGAAAIVRFEQSNQ